MTTLFANVKTDKPKVATRKKKAVVVENAIAEDKVEKVEQVKVESKSTKQVRIPDGIYRIKDYFKDELEELVGKEKNKDKLTVMINTLFLKTVDKVASEFGSKYV